MQTRSNVTLDTSFKPGKRLARLIKAVITPEVAAHILENFNERNRNLTDSTVEAYARDMTSSRWKYNGEAIKFSNAGQLTNGQHRLKACVRSGVHLVTDVLVGMDPDSILAEDTGKSRSVADVIGISTGVKETLSVPRLRSVRNVIQHRRTRLTVSDFTDLKTEFGKGLELVNEMLTMRTGLGKAPVAAGLVIAAQAYPTIIAKMIENVLAGNATTNAQKLLHRYVFVTDKREPEDVMTQKVLYAAYLEVTGSTSSEKQRLKSESSALGFFLSEIGTQGGAIAKAFLAEAKDAVLNNTTQIDEAIKKNVSMVSTIKGQTGIPTGFVVPRATVRRDNRA